MSWIRTLHLLLALVIPALAGIVTGLAWIASGRSRRQTVAAVARVVGTLGPLLAGLRIECEGKDHLQQTGPAVIVFNHQSGLDPVILAAILKRDVVGVAKQPLQQNPLLGPLLRLTDTVFLGDRNGRRERVLEQVSQVLSQGRSVVMAPEGTRVHNRRVGSFRSGACEMAARCQVPLIPVVIHNSGDRLAPRSRLLFPGPIRVSVLAPRWLPPDGDFEQATRQLEQDYERELANI